MLIASFISHNSEVMNMKFKIIFNDGRPALTGLTLDEMVNFKIEHIAESAAFEVAEDVPVKRTREKKEGTKAPTWNEKRDAFMKALNDDQRRMIAEGLRVVVQSLDPTDEDGFYLKVVERETQFFSAEKAKQDRAAKVADALRSMLDNTVIESIADHFANVHVPESLGISIDEITDFVRMRLLK